MTLKELSKVLIKFLDKISPVVQKIEDKFIENSDTLMKLKNVK